MIRRPGRMRLKAELRMKEREVESVGVSQETTKLATSATPVPEVVADTPVESTQENPAEPALEVGADSFTGPTPDAAADTAPEPASKVGEKRKAEDAVQLEELGVGEVGSGRKFTKIRSWEGKFWPFGWGRGHVDGL